MATKYPIRGKYPNLLTSPPWLDIEFFATLLQNGNPFCPLYSPGRRQTFQHFIFRTHFQNWGVSRWNDVSVVIAESVRGRLRTQAGCLSSQARALKGDTDSCCQQKGAWKPCDSNHILHHPGLRRATSRRRLPSTPGFPECASRQDWSVHARHQELMEKWQADTAPEELSSLSVRILLKTQDPPNTQTHTISLCVVWMNPLKLPWLPSLSWWSKSYNYRASPPCKVWHLRTSRSLR